MAMDKKIVAECTGVSVVRARQTLLRDISFSLRAGEAVALMGPNGAGKSTLLKALAGLVRVTRGHLRWFGNADMAAAERNTRVGFVSHENALYGELTPVENLVFAARMHGMNAPLEVAQRLLSHAGLDAVAGYPVSRLSQGMRRRLAMLRALVHQPALILLDEPFASLDAESQGWLEAELQSWRRNGRAILFATHDREQAHRVADHILRLEQGVLMGVEAIYISPINRRWSA